jgi:hypothetical protein
MTIERTQEIVERLRSLADEWFEMCGDIHVPLNEAADELVALRERVRRLGEGLVDHNDRLRSAVAIADRDGRETNWLSFRGQAHYTLAEHHELVNSAREARAALKGEKD